MGRDEQAKLTAQQELDTLSTNLASTYEELSLLYRISGSMKVTQSTMQFFQTICNDLLEVMEVEAAAVVIHPREHSHGADRVVHAGELPISDEQLLSVTLRYLFPRMGTGSRSIIENGFADRAAHLGPGAAKIRSLVAVPMMGTEKCKGVLMALNKTDGEFDSVDLKLVSSICGQAAVFLENHHLYEDLQDLLMGMLHALTASIDAKDPYTCGHSRRVAMLSGKLAEMCGFDEQRARRVYLAGLLHDIGKIGMPEGVLLKNGRLTQEEFESVKKHPRTGARIMSGIPQMEDLNGAILHHHERPDGRGYPDGLAGDEIPVEALIVGLADSFDAMTSSRTYRAALPLDAVITEVRRCSGTQFDPRLVEQLLSLDLHEYLEHLRRSAAEEVVGPMRL
jgi:putative nucleotidyltransferase with HDIG domain